MVSEDNAVEVSEDNVVEVRVLCVHAYAHTYTHTRALTHSLSLSRARTRNLTQIATLFSHVPAFTLSLAPPISHFKAPPPQLSGQIHPPSVRG